MLGLNIKLVLALGIFSLTGANSEGDAKQKQLSMEIKPTGSQSKIVRRHANHEDTLMRRQFALLQKNTAESAKEYREANQRVEEAEEEAKEERKEVDSGEREMKEVDEQEMLKSESEEKQVKDAEMQERENEKQMLDEESATDKKMDDEETAKDKKMEDEQTATDKKMDDEETATDKKMDDEETATDKKMDDEETRRLKQDDLPTGHHSDALLQQDNAEVAKDEKQMVEDDLKDLKQMEMKERKEEKMHELEEDREMRKLRKSEEESEEDGGEIAKKVDLWKSEEDEGEIEKPGRQEGKHQQSRDEGDGEDEENEPEDYVDGEPSGGRQKDCHDGEPCAAAMASKRNNTSVRPKKKKMLNALVNNVVAIASRKDRRKCKYWQNMGCLSDVMEKACSPDEGPPRKLIKKTAVESAWMCCCPNPYQPCLKSQRDAKCDEAMNKYVAKHMNKKKVKPQSVMTALQKVRGVLRTAGGKKCKSLAPETPISTCGYMQKPKVSRSIGRADLFCEMLSWQMEELGDGNKPEFTKNGCPYYPKLRAPDRKTMHRKGQALDDDQILDDR